jgi:hypothetical protein
MSATDLAAVVVVIVATVACTALFGAAWSLRRAARRLQAGADLLDETAAALRDELTRLGSDARRSLERAEDQLDRAGHVVGALEQASRATYRTVASPVIKAAAVATGVRRGAGRLRHGGDPEDPIEDRGRR